MVKGFWFCSLAVAFILMLSSASNGNLIGYWSFEDPNNLGKDSSGKGNNGEVKNNVTWSADGKFGGCRLRAVDECDICAEQCGIEWDDYGGQCSDRGDA